MMCHRFLFIVLRYASNGTLRERLNNLPDNRLDLDESRRYAALRPKLSWTWLCCVVLARVNCFY
jgi:hypothetical protein